MIFSGVLYARSMGFIKPLEALLEDVSGKLKLDSYLLEALHRPKLYYNSKGRNFKQIRGYKKETKGRGRYFRNWGATSAECV